MRLNPAEITYPSFNDKPHDRPILVYDGEGRALVILVAAISGLTMLSLILAWLH